MLPTTESVAESLQKLQLYDPAHPMIFASGLFLFLFTAFAAVYALLQRRDSARIIYVILFSLYFYYKSSGWYLLLLIFTATSDFLLARRTAAAATKRARKWWTAASVTINLGMLGWFKYANFFADMAAELFGRNFPDFGAIFLPVGISFFVFQSMSYTIDVYRGTLKPLDRWTDYLFYISFFPQLVAGPIVRARDFIPQIRRHPQVTRRMFGTGLCLILAGLVKKAIISDYISLNFVDRVFDQPLLYSGFECLTAIYGYALQIYCDFSGYSDMATGLALLLGFHFPKNFDAPYKSATITEFWRRWHISLSTWLRDYLYISLGGNRKGRLRTYVNLMTTMLLGGLWHGAAVRFVLWGALHGAALALHKAWLQAVPRAKVFGAEMPLLRRVAGMVLTFNIVSLGWLLFRAADMQTAAEMLGRIFHDFNAPLVPQVVAGYSTVFLLMAAGYVMHMMPARADEALRERMVKAPFALQVIAAAVTIWCLMQVNSADIQPFIYFQF